MRKRRLGPGLIALAAACLLPALCAAQPYEASWWTVDGGGTTSASGGPYVLGGTAGQPDAGGPFAASPYALHSGFWAIAATGAVGPQADLGVTNTNGQTSTVPGTPVTYTIVVTNAGPSAVSNATVTDSLPAALTGASWTCAASAGSSCPASGSGSIAASVSLLVGGTATFALAATVAPGATGPLATTAVAAVPAGVLDPVAANNSATDTDTLTPRADLAMAKSDAPDPASQGGPLTYTLQVTNLGPSTSPSLTISDTLPADVTFVSVSPGPPTCTHSSGVVTCALSAALAPAAATTVTVVVTVSPTAGGSISNTATVAGTATDPVGSNDSDTEPTTIGPRAAGEILHGTQLRADLGALPGPIAKVDRYRISQRPYASYEIVVDETSGDIGTGNGPALERVAADGSTVLQSSLPAGVGPSRSLAWENATSSAIDDQTVRVRSLSCSTDCGADDTYRLRGYETTYRVPRFNNAGSQITVLLLQNAGISTISGHVYFWSASGSLVATSPFSVGPRALFVLNTAGVAAGQGGTITVSHDGRHGELAGKTVALEPSTGFSFDSPLEALPR